MKRVETDAPRANVSLPVTGMTCAACARTIENTLEDTPGVENANVNFATARAAVTFDPAAVGLDDLVSAVRDVGYDVIETAAAAPQEHQPGAASHTSSQHGDGYRRDPRHPRRRRPHRRRADLLFRPEAETGGSLEPPIAARDIGDDTGSSVFLRAA